MIDEPASPKRPGADVDSVHFERFYVDAWPKLARLARLVGCPFAEVSDLVQDVMVVALERWPQLCDRSAGERFTYLRTTLIRRSLRPGTPEIPVEDLTAWESHRQTSSPVEGVTLDRLAVGEALKIIDGLPKRQRIVVVLLWMDLTVSEVARTMDITESTVRSHLQQARRRLRRLLAEEGGCHE